MAPKIILLIFVVASALFLESEAAPGKKGHLIAGVGENPTLANLCKNTDYSLDCMDTLKPIIKGSHVIPVAALKAEIKVASAMFKQAKWISDRLAKSHGASKVTKQCLSVCSENFGSAVDSLNDSLQAIAQHDQGKLNSQLSAVITYVETCNDAFVEVEGKSPISVTSSALEKIGSNCLAIAQQVRL